VLYGKVQMVELVDIGIRYESRVGVIISCSLCSCIHFISLIL